MRHFVWLIAFAGCIDTVDEPSGPNQLVDDGKADDDGPLWAGLTSITVERYTQDPCNNGATWLDATPFMYDSWARQRAGVRNICFEVWKPGVTDWDNPAYWQQLDVKAHYRYSPNDASYESKYVNSIDRRGNNRRYAFNLAFDLDPTTSIGGTSIPQVAKKGQIEIVSESATSVSLFVDMEVYFTVNGRALRPNATDGFTIRYQNTLSKPTPLQTSANGLVLHDIVTCENGAARFGSGAGYFVADIRNPMARAKLGAGLDGSWIYPVRAGTEGDVMSFTYSTQLDVSGQTLPGFEGHGGLRIAPDGDMMRVELDVFDRAQHEARTVTSTFTGCLRNGN
jgi:hypothetical protein